MGPTTWERSLKNMGAPNPLFEEFFRRGREHFGTRPCWSPSHFGMHLYFVHPHFPSLVRKFDNDRVRFGNPFVCNGKGYFKNWLVRHLLSPPPSRSSSDTTIEHIITNVVVQHIECLHTTLAKWPSAPQWVEVIKFCTCMPMFAYQMVVDSLSSPSSSAPMDIILNASLLNLQLLLII